MADKEKINFSFLSYLLINRTCREMVFDIPCLSFSNILNRSLFYKTRSSNVQGGAKSSKCVLLFFCSLCHFVKPLENDDRGRRPSIGLNIFGMHCRYRNSIIQPINFLDNISNITCELLKTSCGRTCKLG